MAAAFMLFGTGTGGATRVNALPGGGIDVVAEARAAALAIHGGHGYSL
jgi:hypothetical protein